MISYHFDMINIEMKSLLVKGYRRGETIKTQIYNGDTLIMLIHFIHCTFRYSVSFTKCEGLISLYAKQL
ncbi:hypothetical protein MMC2321_00410 [Chitinophaga sp. MM2321]